MKTWREFFEEANEKREEMGVEPVEITEFIKWMYGFESLDDEMSEKDIEKWCK